MTVKYRVRTAVLAGFGRVRRIDDVLGHVAGRANAGLDAWSTSSDVLMIEQGDAGELGHPDLQEERAATGHGEDGDAGSRAAAGSQKGWREKRQLASA